MIRWYNLAMGEIAIFIFLFLILLVGFAGIFLPIFPGIPFMFVVVLIYSFFDKFNHISGREIGILGLLAVISLAIDYASGLLGAKMAGATSRGVIGGLIGSIAGMILFPPFGFIIGLFLGVFLVEAYYGKRPYQIAVKSATGSLLGTVVGIAANALVGILFLILFSVFYF